MARRWVSLRLLERIERFKDASDSDLLFFQFFPIEINPGGGSRIGEVLAAVASAAGKVRFRPPPRSSESDDERRPFLTDGLVDISSSPIQGEPAPRAAIPFSCNVRDLGCRPKGSTRNPRKDFETRSMCTELLVFSTV